MDNVIGDVAVAQAPRELTPFESVLHFFGAELRHWRLLRGLSQSELGARTHDSASTIGKVEIGLRRPNELLARRLDQALDTDGALRRLLSLAEHTVTVAPSPVGTLADEGQDIRSEPVWTLTAADTVNAVATLWRADMRRRTVITTAWAAAALAEPLARWLLDPADGDVARSGGRRVGQADVDALWSMCAAFATADHQLGGAYARATLIHYANQVLIPLLEGTYSDAVARPLFAAAARLCDIAGFMCFDSGRQDLGQVYFVHALRMAKVSGDRTIGAHILTDMSMQAHHQQHPHEAVALADAAVIAATRAGSPSTLARCHAVRARAHALQGDARDSDQALNDAERALAQATPPDEPFWIRFFTPQQLATEAMYVASDLGRRSHVRRHATIALAPDGGMQRRHVLATATLASSHLPVGGHSAIVAVDVDRACEVLHDVVPTVGSLTSARVLEAVNKVRRGLAAHSDRPAVRELEHELQHTVAA